MADRFNGSVNIGGRITRKQHDALCALTEPLLEGDLEDGQGDFVECVSEDFADLVQYCEEQTIALMIQWDGKYEYGAMCEYWVNGKYKQFDTDRSGRIVVTVTDLQEHPHMFICDFVNQLAIPTFPEFAIVEDKRTVKVIYSSGDVITKQLDGTNEEIVASHLGKPFGDTAHIAMCVQIDDKYKQGLMIRNIENDETGRVKNVRREVVKIDDNSSFEEIILTLYSGDECALNDVWVYDMRGEWLNAIGYRNETVRR